MNDIGALVERWQHSDERAAEALYNHFRDRTFHLAYGLLGDSVEAEDAAQDALTYALLNVRQFDRRRASFATWLHAITVSRCRDRYRRRRSWSLPLSEWLRRSAEPADLSPGPERRVMEAEERTGVWQAVRDLPAPLREAIVLRYWAGHTFQEMADILGCPLRTAQSRVRLAFKQLQATLAADQLDSLEPERA